MQIALIILGCIIWYVIGVISILYEILSLFGKLTFLDILTSLFCGIAGPVLLAFNVLEWFSNSDCNKTVYKRKGQ